jgi:periplasmic protein TonB
MEAGKILSAPLIDLIFDGQNKLYGAYELRKNYSKRINRALIITMTLTAFICFGAILASSSKRNDNVYIMRPVYELKSIKEEKKLEKLPEPEIKPVKEQVKTVINTPPEIVRDVDFDKPPPTQEDLIDAKTGLENIDGIPNGGISKPADIDNVTGVVEKKTEKEPDEPRAIVDIPARFKDNWQKFLLRNLIPETPVENGAAAGRYTVVIQFVVDKEGIVSEIKALTRHGFGMEDEAIRVIKKSPVWEPAIYNGNKVKAFHKQLITFDVVEE